MKITYIVAPFDNAEYLIRCMNSLNRQTGAQFDIILAENSFGEYSDEIANVFSENSNILKISDHAKDTEQKMEEAFSLIPEDSDYIMIIDVTTVVSPITAQMVLDCSGVELIVPSAVQKNGNDFVSDSLNETNLLENIEVYSPQRFCFSKELFSRFKAKYLVNQHAFSMFIYLLFVEDHSFRIIEDTCLYMSKLSNEFSGKIELELVKEEGLPLLDKIHNMKNAKVKIAIFEKLTTAIMEYISAQDITEREEAFSMMQSVCGAVQQDVLLKILFEQKIGCSADIFTALSYDEYNIYKSNFADKKKIIMEKEEYDSSFADEDREQDIMVLYSVIGDIKKELSAARADIAVLTKNQNLVLKDRGPAQVSAFSDPVLEIPNLYAQGKLGLKVLWRSLTAWLKFKFRRK